MSIGKQISRRGFVQNSMIGLGMMPLAAMAGSPQISGKPLKVVCIGAHPDDPETGCGGTLAKFAKAGHQITIIYLTTGDAGIKGKSLTEAAAIRKKEGEAACKILKAKPIFVGQIDGNSVVDNSWFDKIQKILESEKPDILFTHWPIDSHKDHLVTSILTQRAYLQMGAKFPLYFYEVCAGRQSQNFLPTDYVDITDVREQKLKAVFCHASQGFVSKEYYQLDHGLMEDFRGLTIRVKAAEAFIKLTTNQGSII